MSKNLNTIATIVGAVAAGATIGILFAPDKGSKTRAKLKEGIDDAST
ncbi:YtxH domain-containing protein [Flavobacterium sp. P21]